jgi:hypothetical protein
MGVGGKHHNPAALTSGKTWYPLYRRLSGPKNQGLNAIPPAKFAVIFVLSIAIYWVSFDPSMVTA